jgi:HSP20 family protein
MNTNNLPLKRRGDKMAIRRENESPVMAIQNEMNRLFDNFFSDPFDLTPIAALRPLPAEFSPRVNVSETDKAMQVTAELPGMEEKDIQISLEQECLVLTGEKKSESEETGKNFHRYERSYGSFQRVIPLVSEIKEDKVEATFKNGVLTIILPKAESAVKAAKKISIKPS